MYLFVSGLLMSLPKQGHVRAGTHGQPMVLDTVGPIVKSGVLREALLPHWLLPKKCRQELLYHSHTPMSDGTLLGDLFGPHSCFVSAFPPASG